MSPLLRVVRIFRSRGLSYLGYLLRGYAGPRSMAWLVFESPFSRLLQRLVVAWARLGKPVAKPQSQAHPGAFLSARDWLPPDVWSAVQERKGTGEPVVLGEIDNDGRVKTADWIRKSLPDIDEIDDAGFVPRRRHRMELVVDGLSSKDSDAVLIRKDFRGNTSLFQHEWKSLAALAGVPWCPDVYRADEDRCQLYKSFIHGPTVRQVLVDSGAKILSAETDHDPELEGLEGLARIEAVWARGRQHFDALPEGFLQQLERHVDELHREGVTGFSLTYGNVVLHPKGPFLIDFDAATHLPPKGLRFATLRNRDREILGQIYGLDVLTERSARRLAAEVATPYSPFDLGGGLATRGFWSIDSGTGRWQFLNEGVMARLIDDARILDLGCFTGLMSLLMLRAGAKEVVAIEQDPEFVERGAQLRRLFEWRDMRSYDGFDMRCGDMRVILEGDWGSFDIVTAFCSLYYLDEDDMRRMVARAAELAPVLVLQAKTDTRREAAHDKAAKSSLEFLQQLMQDNGFPDCEVVAPANYSRPLIVGRRGDGG